MDWEKLNAPQRAAIEKTRGPLLVLAGAGSGKTRVLTYRIAHLIESGEAMPGEICALTFTNKAARVMKDRVAALLKGTQIPVEDVWISTFHSMGAKLLRMYGNRVGLESGFTIYDDSDQLVLIKECMETAGVSDKVVSPRAIMHKINQLKNDGINPAEFHPPINQFMDNKMAPVIRQYDAALRKNNAVDFGDLIFKTLQLFNEDAEFRDMFNERYRFVLVDEYQDTNASQYKLLRLMSEKYRNLCVVGDEDQSIYGWRGADIRNILEFERDFPEAVVVKLEENYRSTGHIIRAASRVIANNVYRKDKTLFTSNNDGDAVEVHFVESDLDEAKFVSQKITELLNEGIPLNEMAIFYRTNAQSRLFEDRLRTDRHSYKIFGGLKFYDRAEVKDALAYMRLFVNSKDEVALQRIINVPTRGIGRSTVDAAREFAFNEKLPLFEAIGMLAKGEGTVGSGPRKKLQVFLDLYASLLPKVSALSPYEFFVMMLEETGYLKMLENENTVESEARLENLKELGTAISDYETRTQDPSVAGFLEEIALINDVDEEAEDPHFISLMTVHSAKGLEFDVVFLVGLEEELFPHLKADEYGETDKEALEEERRICYVGITRARRRLLLMSAKTRRVFGIQQIRLPSRFLEELPKEEVKVTDHAPRAQRSSRFFANRDSGFHSDFGADAGWGDWDEGPSESEGAFSGPSKDSYQVGVSVNHPDYGRGVVVGREGQNDGLKVTVRFAKVGSKKFVVKFAPLEVIP